MLLLLLPLLTGAACETTCASPFWFLRKTRRQARKVATSMRQDMRAKPTEGKLNGGGEEGPVGEAEGDQKGAHRVDHRTDANETPDYLNDAMQCTQTDRWSLCVC